MADRKIDPDKQRTPTPAQTLGPSGPQLTPQPNRADTEDAIPYWKEEAARWRRHAAHFANLAQRVAAELHGTVAPSLRPPSYVDLRSNRYWWFNHMAALYTGWASRAEDRLAHLIGGGHRCS